MISFTTLVWIVAAIALGITILCAVKFKRRLWVFGALVSFFVFALAGFVVLWLTDITYKLCMARNLCSKITGDNEYSVLILFFFLPACWPLFLMVNYFKMKSSEKN